MNIPNFLFFRKVKAAFKTKYEKHFVKSKCFSLEDPLLLKMSNNHH